MNNERIMLGVDNLSGRTVNTLKIGDMTHRRPEPQYRTICNVCSSESSATHSAIQHGSARCRNSGCGKTVARRERVTDAASEAKRLETLHASAAQRAYGERLAAETDGYEIPASRPKFVSSDRPMSERERIAVRAYQAELDAEEQARFAPVRAAEAAIQQTARKLAAVRRDTLLNPKSQDPDLFIDADVDGATMSPGGAKEFNRYHLAAFIKAHPAFAHTERNAEILGGYFERHGLCIVTAEMLSRLYTRMRDAGIAFDAPLAPKPPVVRPAPAPARPAKPAPVAPSVLMGRDYATGRDREFTPREVDRMSSAEYRRAFPVIETMAGLLTAMSDERN